MAARGDRKRTGRKLFVLDTTVPLHDSDCIRQFQEHDLALPITVLEELDHFKKGNDTLNYHAREFLRTLDSLSADRLFHEGVPIGPGLGRVSIVTEGDFREEISRNFSPAKADHHILNAAFSLAKGNPGRPVVLVTKDVNLRMKARSVGLVAQDYTSDHVKDISALYTGSRVLEGVPEGVLQQLYSAPFEAAPEELEEHGPFVPNEFLVLRNGKRSALGVYSGASGTVRRVEKREASGIEPRNAEQTFALQALLDPEVSLVSMTGKAGTGKTLLALAAALERRKAYRQIYVARPVVPLSNKDIGFLPGDVQSKLEPYMQPLYDNLAVIQSRTEGVGGRQKRIRGMLEDERLVIAPLSYIRGRSLVGVYFIVDEAQNLTPHEVKTIITRAGESTKMVFTGDVFQIDHPYLDTLSNGLSYLVEKMRGQAPYAHIHLRKGERSSLAELASNLL